MARDEETARAILDKYFPAFNRCVRASITDYRTNPAYADLRADLTKRSHANVLHDLIWARLKADPDLADVPGIRFPPRRHGRQEMHAEGAFLVRVKKLDKKMRPQNIQTLWVQDFLENAASQLQFILTGFDPLTSVDLCYHYTGPAELDVDVYLRCPNKKGHHWMIQLDEAESAEGTGLAPIMPIGPRPTGPQIRIRKTETETETEETEATGGPGDV